jgi:phosphoglycolate phosphatase-like HAD superfamily hydrolase
VGDETRDIKAAHDNNLRAISVTWGFHFRNLLIRYNPDYVVDNTNDLLKLILSLGSKDITPVIR